MPDANANQPKALCVDAHGSLDGMSARVKLPFSASVAFGKHGDVEGIFHHSTVQQAKTQEATCVASPGTNIPCPYGCLIQKGYRAI